MKTLVTMKMHQGLICRLIGNNVCNVCNEMIVNSSNYKRLRQALGVLAHSSSIVQRSSSPTSMTSKVGQPELELRIDTKENFGKFMTIAYSCCASHQINMGIHFHIEFNISICFTKQEVRRSSFGRGVTTH